MLSLREERMSEAMTLADAINVESVHKKFGTPKKRFLAKCHPLSNGCIGFHGHHDKDGYPRFTFAGKPRPATHAALACVGITVPTGLQANHKCDNRLCVNPDHLFIGTQDDNVKDMMRKNRHAKGDRHTISKLTENAVRDIRTNCPNTSKRYTEAYAEKYGVKPRTIEAVILGQNWKHVDA